MFNSCCKCECDCCCGIGRRNSFRDFDSGFGFSDFGRSFNKCDCIVGLSRLGRTVILPPGIDKRNIGRYSLLAENLVFSSGIF